MYNSGDHVPHHKGPKCWVKVRANMVYRGKQEGCVGAQIWRTPWTPEPKLKASWKRIFWGPRRPGDDKEKGNDEAEKQIGGKRVSRLHSDKDKRRTVV